MAAAIPIAVIIVFLFRSVWLILASVVSILACLGTLTYVLHGLWQLRHVPEAFALSRTIILFLDVFASGAVLFGVVLIIQKMAPSKYSQN